MFLTNYYQMHTGKTAIVVKRDAIFLTEAIAHQVGHVLGAGHGNDKSKTHSTIFSYIHLFVR